ncbi:MAG: hypothetical protein AVDCRST_MAG34-1346, partial [uncultured Nocardioidaceae bacterium]
VPAAAGGSRSRHTAHPLRAGGDVLGLCSGCARGVVREWWVYIPMPQQSPKNERVRGGTPEDGSHCRHPSEPGRWPKNTV